MSVAHMVWIKFNSSVSQETIDEHIQRLSSLKETVPGILELTLGENFTDRANGCTHGVLVVVEDKEALAAYAAHPDHVAVASALLEDATLMALDYEYAA